MVKFWLKSGPRAAAPPRRHHPQNAAGSSRNISPQLIAPASPKPRWIRRPPSPCKLSQPLKNQRSTFDLPGLRIGLSRSRLKAGRGPGGCLCFIPLRDLRGEGPPHPSYSQVPNEAAFRLQRSLRRSSQGGMKRLANVRFVSRPGIGGLEHNVAY